MKMQQALIAAALAGLLATTPGVALAVPASNDAPGAPLPVPDEAKFSVSQSAQLRVNADGTPNGDRVNYRWTVTQVTAQGKKIPDSVNIPEQGFMLHSLLNFDYPAENEKEGTADLPLKKGQGFGEARTVSLMPQDFEVPLKLTTKFTLNGKPISPEDLVGKDGVVTAQYTIKNLSRRQMDVPITTLGGEEKTENVEAMTPFVVEAEAFIPQRFTGLNTGAGLGGADGRGNTQVKWISLPFAPLSPKGKSTFGWAANVTDAVVPAMIIQALPLYIPPREGGRDSGSDGGSGGLFPAVAPPNTSESLAQVAVGLEEFLAGLRGFANNGDGKDPIKALENRVNKLFDEVGLSLTGIAEALRPLPEDLDKSIQRIRAVQTDLTKINAQLTEIDSLLTQENIDSFEVLADNWPEISRAIQRLNTLIPQLVTLLEGNLPIDCSVSDPAEPSAPGTVSVGKVNKRLLVEQGGDYQGWVSKQKNLPSNGNTINDAYTFGGGLTRGGAIWREPEGGGAPDWEVSSVVTVPSQETACNTAVAVAEGLLENSEKAQDLIDRLTAVYPLIQKLAAVPALTPENSAALQAVLQKLIVELPGVVKTLKPLTAKVNEILGPLEGSLVKLQTKVGNLQIALEEAGANIGQKQVELPDLSTIVSAVIEQALASENGQLITGGLSQVGGGLDATKQELSRFISDAVASAKVGGSKIKAKGQAAAAKVRAANAEVNHLKGQVGGLLIMAAESPLIYGGDPADAPPGTQLAGAYEFRVDAADTEAPSTLPRVILGLLLLVAAGVLGRVVAKRRKNGSNGVDGSDDPGPEGSPPDDSESEEPTDFDQMVRIEDK